MGVDELIGMVGFIRGRWVHCGTSWSLSSLFGVVGLIRLHAGSRWVHSASLGLFGWGR